MKNVNAFAEQFFVDANIVEALLELKPMTASGKTFKINSLTAIKESKLDLSFVAMLLVESSKVQHDIAVDAFNKSIMSVYEDNKNAVKIGFLYEQLKNSTMPIDQVLNESIDNIITEGEDAITYSVLSGALSQHKARYADLMLIEQLAINSRIENAQAVVTEKYEIYNPVSYVEINENGAHVRINDDIFCINENSISITNAPSQKFIAMSDIAKGVTFNEDKVTMRNVVGTFIISEDAIEQLNEDNTTTEVNIDEMLNETSHKTRTGLITEEDARQIDNIIAISENFENFAVLSNITVAKNNTTNETGFVAKQGNTYYSAILESTKNLRSFKSFDNILEAIESLKASINVDVQGFFEDEIIRHNSINEADAQYKTYVNSQINAFELRLDKVNTQLSQLNEGSEAYDTYKDIYIEISEKLVDLNKSFERGLVNEGDKEEYSKFFNDAVIKFGGKDGADSVPADKKKEFFKYIDDNWESDTEKAANESNEWGTSNITDDNELIKLIAKGAKYSKTFASKVVDMLKKDVDTKLVLATEAINESSWGKQEITDDNELIKAVERIIKKGSDAGSKLIKMLKKEKVVA